MAEHVYHWKHGWIPLDHVAALSKAKGDHKRASELLAAAHGHDAGIRTKRDLAGAIKDLHNVPEHERSGPIHAIQNAAEEHEAKHLLPESLRAWEKNGSVSVTQHPSGRVHVQSPYDKSFISTVKGLGATWSPKSKTWSVPGSNAHELAAALEKHYGTANHPSIDTLPTNVSIERRDGKILVRSPYNRDFVESARPMGNWNPKERAWQFPEHTEPRVKAAIVKHFKTSPAAPTRRESSVVPPAHRQDAPRVVASISERNTLWAAIEQMNRRDIRRDELDDTGGSNWPSRASVDKMTSAQVRAELALIAKYDRYAHRGRRGYYG